MRGGCRTWLGFIQKFQNIPGRLFGLAFLEVVASVLHYRESGVGHALDDRSCINTGRDRVSIAKKEQSGDREAGQTWSTELEGIPLPGISVQFVR